MRLTYNILWFENEEDFIDSAATQIEKFLSDKGFILNIEKSLDGKCDEKLLKNPKWNLMLMDYNLGEEKGSAVIKSIRDLDISTEVVFYTGNPEDLAGAIQKTPLEGVYWCGRGKDFDQKVKKIITVTLKKLMDPTTMRGLVMAEAADLDEKVNMILSQHHSVQDDTGKAKFRGSILDYAKEEKDEQLEKISKIDRNTCSFLECIDTRVIGPHRKSNMVSRILYPYKNDTRVKPHRDVFVNGYIGDIIGIRNSLAHVVSEDRDGEEVILVKGEVFTEDKAIAMRKNITKYGKSLDGILKGMGEIYGDSGNSK